MPTCNGALPLPGKGEEWQPPCLPVAQAGSAGNQPRRVEHSSPQAPWPGEGRPRQGSCLARQLPSPLASLNSLWLRTVLPQGGRGSHEAGVPLHLGSSGAGYPPLSPSPAKIDSGCSSELSDGKHQSAHWQSKQLRMVLSNEGGPPVPPLP